MERSWIKYLRCIAGGGATFKQTLGKGVVILQCYFHSLSLSVWRSTGDTLSEISWAATKWFTILKVNY